MHNLDPEETNPKMASVPAWMHEGGPCGLGLCPWKDTEWKPSREKKGKQETSKISTAERDEWSSKKPNNTGGGTQANTKKRTRPFRHPDELIRSAKRSKMYCDEQPATFGQGQNANRPCFFWYHGACNRTYDARHQSGCHMKHELDDPRSMIQPPPGYGHRKPCGLEWCRGDAKESRDAAKRYFKSRRDLSMLSHMTLGVGIVEPDQADPKEEADGTDEQNE